MKPMLSIGVILFLAMLCMPSTVQIYGIPIKGVLGCMIVVYICFAIHSYYKVLNKDPKLLQSEHYQLSMRRMDIASQRLGGQLNFQDANNVTQLEVENADKANLLICKKSEELTTLSSDALLEANL